MTIRVLLPVVIETDEDRQNRLIGKESEKYTAVDMVFYNVDVIEVHERFQNFCYVYSSGSRFEVALPADEVDRIIMEDIIRPIVPN